MGGLAELARGGRPERIKPSLKGRILSEAVRTPGGLGRWSVPVRWPSMWEYPRPSCSVSGPPTTLSRIGRGSSNCRDEQFEAKFWDVIGVYLDPPDHAVVLCCDKKSQCQALQRSQPGLPLGQGYFRTVTYDYYRHGTVTLFAALDYLSGKVISQVAPK